MNIKFKSMPYQKVIFLKKRKHKKPRKPSPLLKWFIRTFGCGQLRHCNIKYNTFNMESLPKNQPCIILMNHTCFADLKIFFKYFKRRKFNIICAADGFMSRETLMRHVGCVPTDKFVTDITLIQDMKYCLTKLKTSVLMYPEAVYTVSGSTSYIPPSLGKLVRLFRVPVISVMTKGAFLHDPLYNELQHRDTTIEVNISHLITKEDIQTKSAEEINDIIHKTFVYDDFKYQKESNLKLDYPFIAQGLHRLLYKCPHCGEEYMTSSGKQVSCTKCGVSYTLTEYGELACDNAEGKFTAVNDWYDWEREQARKELLAEDYKVEIPVEVCLLIDYKAIYKIGDGTLTHDKTALSLKGDGGFEFIKPAIASPTLYIDYYWYEVGDIISIGDTSYTYYCFPKNGYPVSKAKLLVEELYKILTE